MPGGQETYTHGHDESVLRSHRWRTARNSAGYLLDHLGAGLDVLDIGCGPGTITLDFARLVAPGRVVGVDNAEEPVQIARAAATGQGIGNVSFRRDDVHSLDFDDDTFDVVHAHQVLQHLTDPVAALREMRRVCKPGGIVAARDADYAAMTWFPHHPGLDRWLELYRAVAHSNGAEPDCGRQLLSWAQAAGFTEVTPSASVWCFATPEDRAWWGGLWADRSLRSGFAEQALERGLASQETLEQLARAWCNWAGHRDGWFGVLNCEIRCTA